jgi:hypothetical protein
VGSKGDSDDNAAAESLIGLHQTELIHRRGPGRGLDDVELATQAYRDWFNRHRLHRSCGDIPPIEYQDNHYRQIAGLTEDIPADPSLHRTRGVHCEIEKIAEQGNEVMGMRLYGAVPCPTPSAVTALGARFNRLGHRRNRRRTWLSSN